ncbi:MAG: hypothetical protein PG981_000503 [Wolbachia endosymbiont of Ctenocephalides orientis wCori]|nr:MAG: hypothetical protein PG981_000503 [Wolbachia endosymbiont of Ctenocephalides orientis wCori]
MKFSVYAILVISLILILGHVTVVFKNWNSYRGNIIQELEKKYDAKIHIGGKVEVSLITPKLTIHNVYIQYNENNNQEQKLSDLVSINKIEIKPSILPILSFSLQAKSITLSGIKSNKKNLLHVINTKASSNIIDVIIKDGQINLKDDFSDYRSIINIKEVSIRKNKHVFGEIKVGDNDYYFGGKIDITKQNVRIDIESDFINLLFTGNKNQDELRGYSSLKINNSSNSINDFSKIANLNFLGNIVPSENIAVSSNISITKEGLKVTDIEIDSQSMKANGTIQNNRESGHTDVNISFSKIDFDLTRNNLKNAADTKDILECFREAIPNNLSLNMNIEASEIKYRSKILNNFRTILKFADGKAKVDTLLKFPGIDNISYLSGEISNNRSMSEFNGNLLIEGNDFESFTLCFFPSIKTQEDKKSQFTLRSKLHFAPRILAISDITLVSDEQFWEGSVKANHTKKHNTIDGRLSIQKLNMDRYNYNLFSNLSKIEWLKSLKYDVKINTHISDFILNDTKIKDLNFLLKAEKGKLVADKLKLSSKDFDITGDAKILADAKYTKPLVEVNLNGSKFDGKIFKLPNLIEVKKNARNDIDQIQWSVEKFKFLDAKEVFDANIQINATEFIIKKNILKDFNLDVMIRNNAIAVRQINYALEEQGQVSFQGYLRPDSMYTKFFVANLDTKRINKFLGANNLKGQISLSGSIKAQGKSFQAWANNLSGEINLQTQGIEFANADFNSFITNLLSSNNKSEISTFAHTDIYNGSTFFENVIGKANINNGICSASLQFGIDKASGSISSNFMLSNFTLASVFRFFFIPMGHSNPIYVDMHLDGPIWRPKMSFDIDQIFITLIGKRNS